MYVEEFKEGPHSEEYIFTRNEVESLFQNLGATTFYWKNATSAYNMDGTVEAYFPDKMNWWSGNCDAVAEYVMNKLFPEGDYHIGQTNLYGDLLTIFIK